ncbi:N-acetylglucosaminyl phosphatidylinositol deacetylase-related [uncultured Caudovirales phage]|uniref:N-acetylglucosaminyl phosphatidylinositol deacetylase-related n=1 Tax=uncultured Caudovirales phage TaxID=2100421 RepID=A0A6J5L7W5_9CAUD|nr:N-acetylglucosaminyl phosphatidylinositol deacetylase-related [uncultured Caudovirales phage]
MRAVALVAHPDDCVIFAWPFIEAHPNFKWTIIYLTYTFSDPRAREVRAYWNKRGIDVSFLGMRDDWQYVKNEELGFDPEIARQDIINAASKYDLILTHFEDGDYGHIHHKFVNTVANKIDKPKVYFASTFNYNTECVVANPVATEELPLHREVIEGFRDRNIGRYIVTPEAELIIKEKQ